MTRGNRARVMILLAIALMLVGCEEGGGGSREALNTGSATQSRSGTLRVAATIHVPAAGNIVTTQDRLWVISGGTKVVTEIDPFSSVITRRVRLPYPVAYGTVGHGSLWLVSMYGNALIELDDESGDVLRTLEGSPELPLNEPIGVAVVGHSLWVLNHRDSTLLRVDQQTGTLMQTTSLTGDYAAGPYLVRGLLWVAMTFQGIFHQVDPRSGKIVGHPIHVPAGLCAWESVVGDDIWATSMPLGHFNCTNGTSSLDTTSGTVTPLPSAEGKSLYTFARYAGRLWATDTGKTVYQVDTRTGDLRPDMIFDRKDSNHLFSAFGSMWMTRPGVGQVLRLRAT